MNKDSLQSQPIDSLYLTEDGVPTFIPVACEYICKLAKTQGVFRINGNKNSIQKLYQIFNHPQCAVPPCCLVHDIAGFIKNWLVTLTEPIIVPSVFNQYFNENDEKSADEVFIHLPDINRKCLAYILNAINEVYKNSNYNQMTMGNISTCFQMCLTKDSSEFRAHVPFKTFFLRAVQLLNDTKTDFRLC